MRNHPITVTVLCTILGALCGCQPSAQHLPAARPMLETISARHIEIVAPLSQPTSLDDDNVPDGFTVVVRTADAQGDPVKITGAILFELYSYRPAAADPKGRLIQTWNHTLATADDQTAYWNRLTRMYEFPLMIGDTTIPHKERLVMVARYTDPWEQRLEHEVQLDIAAHNAALRRRLDQPRR